MNKKELELLKSLINKKVVEKNDKFKIELLMAKEKLSEISNNKKDDIEKLAYSTKICR